MLTLSQDYVAIDCVGYRSHGKSAERRLIVKIDRRWSDRTTERHLAEHALNKLIVRGVRVGIDWSMIRWSQWNRDTYSRTGDWHECNVRLSD